MGDVTRALAHVARECLRGRLPARDANATTAALNALVGAMREADLEERLEAVEQAVGVGRA